MAQTARCQAVALIRQNVGLGAAAESNVSQQLQQQSSSLRQAASTLAQQQPCSGIHTLPRLRLTQPIRSQALGGRRHLLPFRAYSTGSVQGARTAGSIGRLQQTSSSRIGCSSTKAGFSSSSSSSSSSHKCLLQTGRQVAAGLQHPWRAWMQQQLTSPGASSSSVSIRHSSRLLLGRLFSTAGAASSRTAAAGTLCLHSMQRSATGASWGTGVSSWFNNMPAAAAWWDSWTLWVGSHASFVMATLLNSINLAGAKLPVALGVLLVDWAHNSPLLYGSKADALRPPALPQIPSAASAAGFYAATKAPGNSSRSSRSITSLWRSTASGAAAAWGELLDGLSAMARLLWLGCIWMPALLSAPVLLGWPTGRSCWLALMTYSLEFSGPAFIKWGQWAATRHDIFAHDVCDALEKLHTNAPAHSFRYTCVALSKSFALPIDQLFDWIEEVPLACGSVGQVHRAQLSEKGAALTCCEPGEVVAVKVRHPGVSDAIERDFQTMVWVTHIASQLFPSIRSLRLEDTLKQFAAPLHEQVDLSREAANLQRFNTNFRRARGVSFPLPLYPLVSPDVLVESFEHGKHISAYITGQAEGADPYRARLAELGSGTMLQMMLVDNLIHSDLHPGNILVRLEQPHGLVGVAYKAVSAMANPDGMPMRVLGTALKQLGSRKHQPSSSSSSDSSSNGSSGGSGGVRVVEVAELVEAQSQGDTGADGDDATSSNGSRRGVWGFVSQMRGAWSAGGPAALLQQLQLRLHGVAAGWLQPHIVLLDVGMATELSPEDQTNMVGLFRSFAALDGRNVARWTLRFSGHDQGCEDPQAFIEDMADTFETLKKTIAANEAARMRWEQQQATQQKQQASNQQAPSGSSSSVGGTSSGLIEVPAHFDSGAEALSTVLELVRVHGVSLPGHIAGCVVTTLILEGWSNKLAPEHSVLSQVQSMFSPALLPWRSRIDSVVDTVMDRNDTALAMM